MYLSPVFKYVRLLVHDFDTWFIGFLNKHSLAILRVSLAVIFIWFGALKLYGQSPATELITKTVYWFDPNIFVPILGIWEVLIGICMLSKSLHRPGLFLLALQMPGTFLPLVLLPEVCFVNFPFDLTLEGQYIIKNLVLIGAGLVVGSRLSPFKKTVQVE